MYLFHSTFFRRLRVSGVSFQILVPIADGSEEMEAVAIIDFLRRAKANVVLAALGNSLEVVASRKVKLVADVFLDEAEKNSYDLIVLPVSANFFKCRKNIMSSNMMNLF